MCLLLGDNLLEVESKLLSLENVTVNSAGLTGSRRNAGVESASTELSLDGRVELGISLSGSNGSLVSLSNDGLLLASLLLAERLAVVGLVPLSERSGINLDNGRLGQSVGSDKLVVGGVERDTEDSGLSGGSLRAPGEVAGLDSDGSELLVTTTGSDGVDSLGADSGDGTLSTALELSLLVDGDTLGAGVGSLVSGVSRNTHGCRGVLRIGGRFDFCQRWEQSFRVSFSESSHKVTCDSELIWTFEY